MSYAFDFLRNYWFRCFLRRVMVIFRQQKNFGPNVIYFVLRVDSWVSLPPHSSWRLQLRLRLFTAFVVNFFAAVTLYANVYKLSVSNHFQHRSIVFSKPEATSKNQPFFEFVENQPEVVTLAFWHVDVLAFGHFDILAVWHFDSLTFWYSLFHD